MTVGVKLILQAATQQHIYWHETIKIIIRSLQMVCPCECWQPPPSSRTCPLYNLVEGEGSKICQDPTKGKVWFCWLMMSNVTYHKPQESVLEQCARGTSGKADHLWRDTNKNKLKLPVMWLYAVTILFPPKYEGNFSRVWDGISHGMNICNAHVVLYKKVRCMIAQLRHVPPHGRARG